MFRLSKFRLGKVRLGKGRFNMDANGARRGGELHASRLIETFQICMEAPMGKNPMNFGLSMLKSHETAANIKFKCS